MVKISEEAESCFGTTSEIEANEVFTVWELLHALMLPSGNDSGVALAEHFGNLLIQENEAIQKKIKEQEKLNAAETGISHTNKA